MIAENDRGFTLGDGAFETMLVRDGVPFRLDAHLERLGRALAALRIPEPPGLRQRVLEAAAGPGTWSLRLTVSRGPAGGGLAPPQAPAPTLSVLRWPVPPPPRSLRGHIVSGRRNEKAAGAGLKLLGYAEAILGLFEARDAGADEALFLDTAGHLCEAGTANLFLVRGDALLTPPLSCGVLPGITRELVFESFPEAREQELLPADLFAADEAFLTSSVRGVVPLVEVNGRPIGAGAPGPVCARVQAAVNARIDEELGGGCAGAHGRGAARQPFGPSRIR